MVKFEIGPRLMIKRKIKFACLMSYAREYFEENTTLCMKQLQDDFKKKQKEQLKKGKYLVNLVLMFGHNADDFVLDRYTGVAEAWVIKISRITKKVKHVKTIHRKQSTTLHEHRINGTIVINPGTGTT